MNQSNRSRFRPQGQTLENRLCYAALVDAAAAEPPATTDGGTLPSETIALNFDKTSFLDSGAHTSAGQDGSDLLIVNNGDGSDFLEGGDGADVLRGGAGNDTLLGNRGNDIVLGQDGNDLLIVNTGDGSDFLEATDAVFEQLGR